MNGLRWNSKISKMLLTAYVMLLALVIMSGCSNMTREASSNHIPKVVKKEKWTEIENNIFVFTSDFYMANMTLITNKNEGILIDAGMDKNDLQSIQQFLETKNIKLKNIIITHMHDDHSANLKALRSEDAAYVTPLNAKNDQIIELSDRKLKIIFTEGHYKAHEHISVELIGENILVAGDIICNNILPPIAAGGQIEDLLSTLKGLEEKKYSLIIPGHGEIVKNDIIFSRQFEYLNNAKKHVEKVILSGGKMSDLKSIGLEDCIKDTSYLYAERLEYWHLKNLETIYLNLKTNKS